MTSTNPNQSRLDGTDDVTVFSAESASTNVISSAREAWKFRGFIGYMTRRDLRTTYTRSYLGWFWSLLNPIAEVAIYSLVFGVLLGIQRTVPDAPNGFNSFPHFLMSGTVTWGFFRMTSNKVINNFTSTVRLRRKLYFPPIAAALSTVLSTMVDAGILMVIVVLFFGLWGHLSIHAVLLVPAALFAASCGLGVGLALSVANSKYRDISYLYSIVLRLSFYLLPLIWPIQTAANRFGDSTPWLKDLVVNNPFAKMIEFGRDGLLYMIWPSLGDWISLTAFSLAILLAGWTIFARSSADVAEGLG